MTTGQDGAITENKKIKMKNKIFFLSSLLLAFILSGCRPYNTLIVNRDVSVDFSKYETFAWLKDIRDTANSPYNNEVIRNNIRNYFGKSFARRGYTLKVDSPDVLLQIEFQNSKVVDEITFRPFPRPHHYYARYYFGSDFYSPYPYNYYYTSSEVRCYPNGLCKEKIEYMEGSITLNVIDRKKNKMVWTCTSKGNIYDPSFINDHIHPAVISIMRFYPVKAFYPVKKYNKNSKNTSEKTV